MSRKVVLDGDTFVDALAKDALGVGDALIRACDRMVLNPLIWTEYTKAHAISALLLSPKLEQLKRMRPPKALTVDKPRQKTIEMPRHHRELFEGALKGQAQIVIMNIEHRGRWAQRFQTLAKEFGLQILKPAQYVAAIPAKADVPPLQV